MPTKSSEYETIINGHKVQHGGSPPPLEAKNVKKPNNLWIEYDLYCKTHNQFLLRGPITKG